MTYRSRAALLGVVIAGLVCISAAGIKPTPLVDQIL